MSTAASVLYRKLPKEQLGTLYPAAKDKLPFFSGTTHYTAHPKETALIRATAIAALAIISYVRPAIFVASSSYVILCSYVFPPKTDPWNPGMAAMTIGTLARSAVDLTKLSLVGSLATLVYAAWTAYSHIYREDALVNSFHQIAGSKEKFEKLPELPPIAEAKCVNDWIAKTDWNKLANPAYRAQTSDGRQILIVRTCQKDMKKYTFVQKDMEKCTFIPNSLRIEVYVEKYDESDNDPTDTSLERKVMEALINSQNSTFSYESRTSGSTLKWGDKTVITSKSLSIHMKSQMTADRANELFAQLA